MKKNSNQIAENSKFKNHNCYICVAPKIQPILFYFVFVLFHHSVEIVKSAKTTKDANELIQKSRSCCHSGTQVQNEKEWSLIWTGDDSLFFHLLVVYSDCAVTLRTHICSPRSAFFHECQKAFWYWWICAILKRSDK